MQSIQVTRVAVKAKVFDSGDTAWPVMHTDNQWYDLHRLNSKPTIGEVYDCDVKVTTKDTPAGQRTYRNAYPKPTPVQVEKAKEVLKPVITATKLYPPPDPESKPEPNKVRTTPYTHSLDDYEKLINYGFQIAGANGITDDAARVSLVAILCIAYGEGKLSIDDLPSVQDDPEAGGVEDWGDREWFEGPAQNKQIPDEDHGETMEAAKARTQALIGETLARKIVADVADKTDYKTQLGAAIKTYCAKNKLDFKEHKFQTLFKCAGTMKLETLNQEQAKQAMENLKVM